MPPTRWKIWLKRILIVLGMLALFTGVYFITYCISKQGISFIFRREKPCLPALSAGQAHLPVADYVNNNFSNRIIRSISGLAPGIISDISPDPVPDDSTLNINGTGSAGPESTTGNIIADAPSSDDFPVIVRSDLPFGSFTEGFVGVANIDWTETTLYRDKNVTAVFFPPDYAFAAAPQNLITENEASFSGIYINDFNGPYQDKRCLGKNCLTQDGLNLSYNGQALAHPSELAGLKIEAVSIGALSDNWLVGFIFKNEEKFAGRVFYFNGKKFTEINFPATLSSPHFGLFGFGGEESDFLIIYGAYEGKAYRVCGTNVTDISRWFPIRVMNYGFKPEIIRAANGSNINWYVYSATKMRPWLIKLWQNNTADIVGEAVFDNFFSNSTEAAIFKLISGDKNKTLLLMQKKDSGGKSWQTFTDRGFKNEKSAVLVSKPIAHDGPSSQIIIKRIASAGLSLDSASLKDTDFLFSENGTAWREIPTEENQEFITGKIDRYLLKVVFPGYLDKFYSPFLSAVYFDYYCEKFPPVVKTDEDKFSTEAPVPENSLDASAVVPAPETTPVTPPEATPSPESIIIPDNAIRLQISSSGFVPRTFTVGAGKKVILAINSVDNNSHVFLFPGGSLITSFALISGNETKIVTFTAPVAGTYLFRDDIPAYRANTGEMIVE